MEKWLAFGADQVDRLAQQDPLWLELKQQQDLLAPAFDRLVETLPEDQRELILEYLNLQLDMESRKTCLAWTHR